MKLLSYFGGIFRGSHASSRRQKGKRLIEYPPKCAQSGFVKKVNTLMHPITTFLKAVLPRSLMPHSRITSGWLKQYLNVCVCIHPITNYSTNRTIFFPDVPAELFYFKVKKHNPYDLCYIMHVKPRPLVLFDAHNQFRDCSETFLNVQLIANVEHKSS